MVKPEIAKTTEPKQSTHATGVCELCGGLGEPILYHTFGESTCALLLGEFGRARKIRKIRFCYK